MGNGGVVKLLRGSVRLTEKLLAHHHLIDAVAEKGERKRTVLLCFLLGKRRICA